MKWFAHSPKDGWLVAIGLFHAGLVMGAVLLFGVLPGSVMVALAVVLALLHLTNVNVVSHNFVHNPYFSSPVLNRLFSQINTVCLGMSQEAYRVLHGHHHAFVNDLPDENGETKDRFSIYRRGRNGQPEPVWRYIVLCHFRMDIKRVWRQLRKQRRHKIAATETIVGLAVLVTLTYFNSGGMVWIYIPATLAGWTLVYMEAYAEHYNTPPKNRWGNAVSCYSAWYNRLWFNNGYHMEHHLRPHVHWSRLPSVRGCHEPAFLANGYRVVKHSHLVALLLDRGLGWPQDEAKTPPPGDPHQPHDPSSHPVREERQSA